MATEALIKKGFKKIGAFISDISLSIGEQRYKGFMQAMDDYGIPVEEEFVVTEKFPLSMHEVYLKTCEMAEAGNIPEAIFLGNGIITASFWILSIFRTVIWSAIPYCSARPPLNFC